MHNILETNIYDHVVRKYPPPHGKLTVRICIVLANMQIRLVKELYNTTEKELMRRRNFGLTSLNEIRTFLKENSLPPLSGPLPIPRGIYSENKKERDKSGRIKGQRYFK